MEIKIKASPGMDDEPVKNVYLTDEDLDNDNFIGLAIGEETVDLSIDDLMSAIIAFDSKRSRRLYLEESKPND